MAVVHYDKFLTDLVELLQYSRHTAARSVNAVMTTTYWLVGQRIVEHEQQGEHRAEYGEELLKRLSKDLGSRFGRGFSLTNLKQFRKFFLLWHVPGKGQTPSDQLGRAVPAGKGQTLSDQLPQAKKLQTVFVSSDSDLPPAHLAVRFPLPWSHYVRLLSVEKPEARQFYEEEALRGGWSVRQLDRQISTLFHERTLLSKNKAAMLTKGSKPKEEDLVTAEEEVKDPFVLEFLGLKDEYSESDLEEALIGKLESFLLELGGDFAFVGRQRRLRIGDEWFRVDLVFFHRTLRCLIIIDLKAGKFTHSDAGQMHLYCNYAREHWMRPGENPPVGLILCAAKNEAVAHYALEGLRSKVLAAEYKTKLPAEKLLEAELGRTRKLLEARKR